jgi:hypothetical protein
MKYLEQIIRENRTTLDSFEPGKHHLDHFRNKLLSQHGIRKISIADYLKIAAVVLLATMFSFFIYSQLQSFISRTDKYSLGDVSREYREVEQYYIRMINNRYSELGKIDTGDPVQKNMLILELEEMDKLFINLQKDLKANPGDERIINAMIRHYQMKLEIMNQIVIQLQSINNNINTTDNESTDI